MTAAVMFWELCCRRACPDRRWASTTHPPAVVSGSIRIEVLSPYEARLHAPGQPTCGMHGRWHAEVIPGLRDWLALVTPTPLQESA